MTNDPPRRHQPGIGAPTANRHFRPFHATGLYYLRARYYDPQTAQFLARDPLAPFSQQPYTYAAANPLNLGDASGLLLGIPNPLHVIHEGLNVAWHGITSAARWVSGGIQDVGVAVYEFAKSHPELATAFVTVTACAISVVGCEVVGVVALSANIGFDINSYIHGDVSTSRFITDLASNLIAYGGAKMLPYLLYGAGRPDLAVYSQIGYYFNGRYRSLLETGAAGLEELLRIAATAGEGPPSRC